MQLLFGIVLSLLLVDNCKGRQQKKGLVVEVQSHNQALKSANPITDLEQTISQGMKDPFTDPRFVMNRINNEFFGNGLKNNINAGTPMVENSLHNQELMAFRNLGFNAGSLNLAANRLASDPITQHAIKENHVPLMQGSSNRAMQYQNLQKLLLASKKHTAPKISSVHSPVSIPKMSLEMPKDAATDVNIAHMNAESIQPSAANSPPGAAAVAETASSTDTGFGASPQSSPTIIESSQNIGDTLSSMLTRKGVKANDILPENPGSITGREMEDNYSSIKAFLEADNSLRQKKVLDPVRNPLEDLMNKKHHVPKGKISKKIVGSK